MTNMLQDGATWLGRKLQAHAGRTVRLVQGTTTIDPIVASVAMHDYDILAADGFLTSVAFFDWTFVAADLFDLQLRTGAVVTETIGGIESKYEAFPIGTRPCVERADSSGVLVTLHTKKVN